jgi:MFS superfamily sulfate permease-like transporter
MSSISLKNNHSAIGSRLSAVPSSASLLQTVLGGLITGFLQIVLSVSHAALVYGGILSPYLNQGIGFALVGALIIATVVSLFSSLPGTVGSNQDVSVAIFSVISVSIAASMSADTPIESVFITVVSTIALTTLLSGLFFLVLGTFRLGELVRYLPYPVVGGFLAGTGWLLFKGGFLLVNRDFFSAVLVEPVIIKYCLPSLLLSLLMLFMSRKIGSTYVLPVAICGGLLFLDDEGEKVYVLRLQGFIFFGTVDRLFKKIRNRLYDSSRTTPQFVVLDFRRVETLDSTGMLGFSKLKTLTGDLNIRIIITAPSMKIKRQLEKGGLPASLELVHYFPTLDSGLEWCEDMVLKGKGDAFLIETVNDLKNRHYDSEQSQYDKKHSLKAR